LSHPTHPFLSQGPTSSGKTSLVAYLAAQTGHPFVRINNHQHTDLQEYLGSWIPDETGRLVFREGALVSALRAGHWLVLDELNLAPTEVLEALNRCGLLRGWHGGLAWRDKWPMHTVLLLAPTDPHPPTEQTEQTAQQTTNSQAPR
jgi:hypothetical protein